MLPRRFVEWRRLRQKNEQIEENRLYPVIPSRFIDYCETEEHDDMPVGLVKHVSSKFSFYYTAYPRMQHTTRFVKELDSISPKTKFTNFSFQFAYNDIQSRVFQRLYTDKTLDNDWFEKNDEFINGLSTREKFALVAMTNKSQQHVQSFLRNKISKEFRDRVRAWKTDIYGYLPIFFPIITQEKIEPSKETYQYIIDKVCPILSDYQIDLFIADLYKEITSIFKKCPRTTREMTVFRGVKREYLRQKGSGFTSVTINPVQSLIYTNNTCCLQRITILPKTPFLFIGGLSSFSEDMECLLPDNTEFYTVKKNYESIPNHTSCHTSCLRSSDLRRMLVYDMVALV